MAQQRARSGRGGSGKTAGGSKPKPKPKPAAVRGAGTATGGAGNGAGGSAAGGAHERASGVAASRLIDDRIRALGGWRGETLARMRALILEADPEMTEEWKWMGTPVWSHHGNVCTGETYAKVVKLTFARGASLPDPAHLFNSSLDGKVRRAIDIREGERVEARAFKALVRAAVAENARSVRKAAPATGTKGKVKLLAGGNPQIPKGDGDAPVQAYIAAMPGWKREIGAWLDALIVRTVPDVRKAVRWNSPMYGLEGRGWFVSFHTFTRYVKVTFFRGASLRPLPPGPSKDPNTRYLDIHEDDDRDEAQVARWLRQAAALPGWVP